MTMMMVRIIIMNMMTAIEAVVVIAVTGHQTGPHTKSTYLSAWVDFLLTDS